MTIEAMKTKKPGFISDPEKIEDEITKKFGKDMVDALQLNSKDTYDDLVYLYDKIGDLEVSIAAMSTDEIEDADEDTGWRTEQAADEDHLRGRTKGTEVFDIDDVGVLTLAKQSGASVHLGSNQLNIASNGWVKVLLDTELYDIQGEFANNKFTAKTAGHYLVTAAVEFDTGSYAADTQYGVAIRVNNGTAALVYVIPAGNAYLSIPVSKVLDLAIGDYVELFVLSADGADTLDLRGVEYGTWMTVDKIA